MAYGIAVRRPATIASSWAQTAVAGNPVSLTASDVRDAADGSAGGEGASILRKVRLTGAAKEMADAVENGSYDPYFTQVVLLDATQLLRRKSSAARLSYMDLLLDGVIAAAVAAPDVLSSYADGEATYYRHVGVAIATATADGLSLPVLRQAETLEARERAVAWRELVGRAERGELLPEDMDGATIALSTLETHSVETGAPSLAPGLSTAVTFGELAPRVMITDSGVMAKQTIYATIAYDQRVIDGALASRFTWALKSALETGSAMQFLQ
jgi:pyruvate/2-oxoglutarate dehydrogenase complex dihydrolipoamide acyltransferase (E2) component